MRNWSTKYTFVAVLLLLISGIFSYTLVTLSDTYSKKDFWERLPKLKYIYQNSQYVSKAPTEGWIPDELVNAYAGGEYVLGVNPILIAPDTPPFGRYLIGFSALLFHNENIITLISAITSLLLVFIIGRQIFQSIITALVGVLFVLSEPIFLNQLRYTPLLDIIQLMFLLLGFYLFNRGFRTKKYIFYYFLTMVVLGLFVATKFFATGVTIVAAYGVVLLLRREKKRLMTFLVLLPVALLTLLITYIRSFILNPDIRAFLGIQRWVYEYHKSQLILPFTIWPLLLLNKWYVWYGDKPIISDPQWRITWPIITILTFFIIGLYIFKKLPHKKEVEVLMSFAVCYILFFSLGQVTARYLVIYIPILYLVSLFGVEHFFFKFAILKKGKKT